MSAFAVTLERIAGTRPIPGADRIEVAMLAGMDFEFVVPRGRYGAGDHVLYLPVDSLLLAALIERLGLTGRLAGPERNRVKTIRLRGQISQGLVASPDLVPAGMTDPQQMTTQLGVTKYEPPEEICFDAILTRRPAGQGKYDIESADRHLAVAELLMDQPVCITEKIEGSNLWVRSEADGTVTVGQRSFTITPREGVEHSFHTVARRQRLGELARSLAIRHHAPVVIYGEAIGPKIQGNIYGRKLHEALLFDVRVGSGFLSAQAFMDAVGGFFGSTRCVVPVLLAPGSTSLRAWLADRTIKAASDGRSQLAGRPREGIVIKPLQESYHPDIGRLLIKQRSPRYLAKSDL